MINDVSRAYFYAKAVRDLYIELPSGDPEATEDQLGKLNVCLYGTRDAAKCWQTTLSDQLVSLGFIKGKGHPSVFWHPVYDIRTLVHGDDYVSSGDSTDLKWLEAGLAKSYKIKTQTIGMEEGQILEGKVLNRVLRCGQNGWQN